MSDMLIIARSGVLASRTALAVTAENVANAATEGYRRRDVSSIAAAGGQTTPTTMSTGGQGVSVTEIRRAFDQLVAERARTTVSAQSATSAHLGVAQALEAQLVPGEDGLDGTMRAFFDAFARLAASPADTTTRQIALNSADALARDMAQVADSLTLLRRDTVAQAGLSAQQAQSVLAQLHSVNLQLGQLGAIQTPGHHALADRRDALLGELAGHLPITVDLQPDGRADIRLGSAAGPVLLDRAGPASLAVSATDQLSLHITLPDGTTRDTRLINGGRLGGLANGIGAIDMARTDLDMLARNLADGLNRLHRTGIDLTGQTGGDLFRLDGLQAQLDTASVTRLQVTTQLDGAQSLTGPISLTRDSASGLWMARDADGTLLGTGAEQVTLPGLRIQISGAARDGDRITLTPVSGRAADLRLVVSDPRALAAASDLTLAPYPANSGVARLQATREDGFPGQAVDVVVTDPALGLVELRNPADDSILASGVLDADGRLAIGGLDLLLTGAALAGDRFAIRPTGGASGNGDVAQAMTALRRDATGNGAGLLEQLTRLQGDLGIRAAAAQRADDTAQARRESAMRDEQALGAVNLDVEAARMVQLQQGYQASAQAMSIARSLFDTLLRMI